MRPALLLMRRLLLLTMTLTGRAAGETSLLDPQFNSIATCPCDLTSGACDVSCCCDTECTDADKTLFDCPVGVFYGNDNATNLRSCDSSSRLNPDYHQFTCVFIENFNAYLGYYFPVTAVLPTLSEVKSKSVSNVFEFGQAVGAFALTEATATSQRRGLIVLQRLTNVASYSGSSAQLANTRLSLPARSLDGSCDYSAGVVFLSDNSTAACDVVVTSDLCSASVASPIDYLSYACTGCNRNVTNRDGTTNVPVTVVFQQLSSAVTYEKGQTGSSPTANDITNPANPSVNGTSCSNAVVEVQFLLRWNRTELTSVTATYLFASVTLNSTLTQKFSTAFLHAASPTSVTRRSGRVGYDPEAPIVFRQNGNASVSTQPLLTTDASGICQTGDGESVEFLVNSARYCSLQLQINNFTDCNSLITSTTSLLGSQFPADSVGVHGAANVTVGGDWTTLFTTPPSSFSGSDAVWQTSDGFCGSVPTGVTLTVLYAEQGKANDSSIWHVVGATVNYTTSNLTLTCSLGTCSATVGLATRIRYVRVPTNWLTVPGASIATYKTECWWGICWEEIAYPLSNEFDAEPKARSQALMLMVVAILIYACCVSYPWW